MPKPPTRHRAGGGAGRAARTRRRTRGTPSNPDPSAVSPTPPAPSVGQSPTTGKDSTSADADKRLTKAAKRHIPYSRALAQRVCSKIIEGWSVRGIGELAGMPAAGTIYKWIALDQGAKPVPGDPERRVGGFRELYREAKALQAELMAEEMLAIADRSRLGVKTKETKDGTFLETGDMVERARLQVDTRKWLLAKLLPKKWGDKVQVEASGVDGGPIQVNNAPLTLPALDAVLAKLLILAPKKDDDEGGDGGASPVPA